MPSHNCHFSVVAAAIARPTISNAPDSITMRVGPYDHRPRVGRLLRRLGRQVRIAHRDLRIAVAQDLLHLIQAAAPGHQQGRTRVAQVVQAHRGHLGVPAHLVPSPGDGRVRRVLAVLGLDGRRVRLRVADLAVKSLKLRVDEALTAELAPLMMALQQRRITAAANRSC